jgi:ABC-type tungstate transport system permease subunit
MTARIPLTIFFGLFLVWPVVISAEEHLGRELKVMFPVTFVAPGLAHGVAKLFETEYKIPVKIITLCTGDAIHFVKQHEGAEEPDAMIGHEPDEEAQFVKDGYAVNLRPVCYSDFILVGPGRGASMSSTVVSTTISSIRSASAAIRFWECPVCSTPIEQET